MFDRNAAMQKRDESGWAKTDDLVKSRAVGNRLRWVRVTNSFQMMKEWLCGGDGGPKLTFGEALDLPNDTVHVDGVGYLGPDGVYLPVVDYLASHPSFDEVPGGWRDAPTTELNYVSRKPATAGAA